MRSEVLTLMPPPIPSGRTGIGGPARPREPEPPAHFLERFRPPHDDLLDAEKSRNPDDYHETVERYRYTMSVSLETLERTLKERLQEFQSLKELIAREAVLRATLLDFSAQRSLLSQLDSASVVLMDWVEHALEQVTPFFRSR